jgi:hypothetical protein
LPDGGFAVEQVRKLDDWQEKRMSKVNLAIIAALLVAIGPKAIGDNAGAGFPLPTQSGPLHRRRPTGGF